MSREGRSQPIQPFATHGFLGNVPANGVLPGRVLVVDAPATDDRRRKTPPLQPVVISGVLALPPPTVTPPPPPLAVEPPRPRRLPEQPVALNGLYAVTTAPAVNPPPPTVIPLGERPRVTPPPQSLSGFDVGTPPLPLVVPISQLAADAIVVSVARGFVDTTPPVLPPGPFVIPIEERRHILERLRQPTSTHGFLGNTPANGVLPPPPSVVPPDLLVTSSVDVAVGRGFVDTTPPAPPVVVQAGTDWAASIASFY